MPKKRIELKRWYLKKVGANEYYAENGDSTIYVRGEHCRCCAYAKVIGEHGGDADLRGLGNSPCYQFLAVMVRGERDPITEEENI